MARLGSVSSTLHGLTDWDIRSLPSWPGLCLPRSHIVETIGRPVAASPPLVMAGLGPAIHVLGPVLAASCISFGTNQMAYRIAVVGATGAVGREMLRTLALRAFPVSEVIALASGRSTGSEISFGEGQMSFR